MLVCPCRAHASIANGCGPVVNVPLGVAGSFVISSMTSGPSIGLVACIGTLQCNNDALVQLKVNNSGHITKLLV